MGLSYIHILSSSSSIPDQNFVIKTYLQNRIIILKPLYMEDEVRKVTVLTSYEYITEDLCIYLELEGNNVHDIPNSCSER